MDQNQIMTHPRTIDQKKQMDAFESKYVEFQSEKGKKLSMIEYLNIYTI